MSAESAKYNALVHSRHLDSYDAAKIKQQQPANARKRFGRPAQHDLLQLLI